MMKKNVFFTIRKTVPAFLVVVLLLALCPVIAHADSFGSISVQTEDNTYSLQVMYSNKGWYLNSEDIARIGNLRVSYNADQKILFIVRQDPVVILYQADSTEYVQVDGIYYVPLQEASVACGIRFYEVNNKLCFEALRTPKDLIAELGRNVFADKRFRLTEFYLDLGLLGTAAEVTARSYAMVSPFSISAYGKALSGEADQERYNQAMATIIAYDSDDVSSFAALADIDKSFTKTDKMLDAFDWVFEKSSKFSYWLSGSDWTEAELKTLTDQMEFYGELGGVREFLNAYSDVSKIMDLKYILNVILYIETVTEAESNIANAMQKVFSKSDNTHSCVAASKILAYRYGPGTAAVDIMGSAAVEVASNQIDSLFSDLAYGDLDWKTKVAKFIVTKVLDYGFQLSDKSSAIIYLPIYGNIQNDLALYYYNNKYTDSNENYTDLRSVGIMYLKAAIAAYKNFDFDNSLADTISYAKETLKNELNVLLGYAECEYAPDYTNQIILDRLNSQGVSNAAPYPSQEELFNETFWHLTFGQTLGTNFDALFHKDGTFTARSYGSGSYDDGTYTYDKGILTINFWCQGAGNVFEGDENGFVSRDKHKMQVGEDYLHIYPIEGVSDFYNQPPPTPSPTPTPMPTPISEEDVNALSDGEHYGELNGWTSDTMIVEWLTVYGYSDLSGNILFNHTGQYLTLDISGAEIVLDSAYGDGVERTYDSISSAMCAEVWGTTFSELSSRLVCFTVINSQVTKVLFQYQA